MRTSLPGCSSRRGLTILELLVITLVIMGGITLVALPAASHSGCCKLLRDSSHIRGIQQSWIVFSREFGGVYPTPGLIDRQPDPVVGKCPDRGAENKILNDTAALHALCLMQNYY